MRKSNHRLFYALVGSVMVHLFFLASLQGWDSSGSSPLRFPGVLLVELINLSSSGAVAHPAETGDFPPADEPEIQSVIRNAPRPRPAFYRRMTLSQNPGLDELGKAQGSPNDIPAQKKGGLVPADAGSSSEAESSLTPLPPDQLGNPTAAVPQPPAPPLPPPSDAPIFNEATCANCPPPQYPPLAQQRGLEGTIVLKVQVRADGSVGVVYVETSPGYPLLEDAAIAAVKTWTFYPATENSKPVESEKRVKIPFTLTRP